MDLVEEFKKTLDCERYDNELKTIVYTEDMLDSLEDVTKVNTGLSLMATHNDTVSEILGYRAYTAALNFADGYEPGGLVLYGAKTQEEALCRSSNLYKSLTQPQCIKEYYEYNKKHPEFSEGKSSDRIIYTRDVAFFRDSELNWLDDNQVKHCDIITCPAPVIGTASDAEIMNRMRNIIRVADDNRVTTLILGCWGCGAFGNRWDKFARLWMQVIKGTKTNCNIVFATREQELSRKMMLG